METRKNKNYKKQPKKDYYGIETDRSKNIRNNMDLYIKEGKLDVMNYMFEKKKQKYLKTKCPGAK